MAAEMEQAFLQLLQKILLRHGYEVVDELRNPRRPRFGEDVPDLVLSKDGLGVVLEAKLYQNSTPPPSVIRQAIDRLASAFEVEEVDRAVLVVNVPFSEARLAGVRRDPRLEVWDLRRLRQMTESYPDLSAELKDFLRTAGVGEPERTDNAVVVDKVTHSDLPQRAEYYVATVGALRSRGGTAHIGEIEVDVAHALKIDSEALAIPHGGGRRSQFQYDLAWVRTYLKWAGAIHNHERGVWSLTELGASMSDDELRGVWKAVVSQQRDKRKSAPEVPIQGPGPHFSIRDGLLSFAAAVDDSGNDQSRLSGLHPLIRDTARDLVGCLKRDGTAWPALERAVLEYLKLVEQDLPTIDFGRLFGQGMLLSAALATARTPEARGNFYLTAEASSLTDALMGMHGAFMMGSRDGQSLINDAHKFDATGAELRSIRDSELEISRAVAAPMSPASEDVKAHVRDLVENAERGRPDHYDAYLGATVRNVAIVAVGGAVLLTLVGMGGPTLAIPAYLATLIGSEAVKKSKLGKQATDKLVAAIDAGTIDFVSGLEIPLRNLAGSPQMSWLGKALDWIPAMRDTSPPAPLERVEPTIALPTPDEIVESNWRRVEFAVRVLSIENAVAAPIEGSVSDLIEQLHAKTRAIDPHLLSGATRMKHRMDQLMAGGPISREEAAEFARDAERLHAGLTNAYRSVG